MAEGGDTLNAVVVSSEEGAAEAGDAPAEPEFEGGVTYSWQNVNVFSSRPSGGAASMMKQEGAVPPPGLSGDQPPPKSSKNQPKHILKNVTGIVKPGELLALMGSSGAGKTTLLNVLHFNSGKLYVEGDLCVNGVRVTSSEMSSISGYVQQEDLFIPVITVKEHLIFTARVKLSSKMSYSDKLKRVDKVIHELGLTKCQNSKIGDPAVSKGISGGEMKRLAFASEYLSDPAILFCDEPTSGLDSFMAQSVVEVMKSMAKAGKTIICTIHQPASEVFEMFDHIYLMSGGRVAFTGLITEAMDFFAGTGYPCPPKYNPADFFIFTLAIIPGEEEQCRERVSIICDAYSKSPKCAQIEEWAAERAPGVSNLGGRGNCCTKLSGGMVYQSSWLGQLNALFGRSFLCIIRDPVLMAARLVVNVTMALLIGLVFFQLKKDERGVVSFNGCIIMVGLTASTMNAFGVMFVLCSEYPVLLREHWNGMYRIDTYFIAKTTAEIPFITFYALIVAVIDFWLIGFEHEGNRFIWFIVVMLLLAHVSCSFGYLLSAACKKLVIAISVGPMLLIPLTIFSGFILRDESTPTAFKWIKYLSWIYHSNEILFVNQWQGTKVDGGDKNVIFKSGQAVLNFFSFSEDHWDRSMYSLGALFFGMRILAFLCMLARSYDRN